MAKSIEDSIDSHCNEYTLKRNLALINARPRKGLNFLSAQSLWDLELLNCCTYFDKSLKEAGTGGGLTSAPA